MSVSYQGPLHFLWQSKQPEEVGTGHVSSKNADMAPLTLYCCFFLRWLFLEFWTISAGTNRRAERSSE